MDGERQPEIGMQQKHRQHIIKNLNRLTKCTNYNEIITETVRRGLLSPVMRRHIEELNGGKYNLSEDETQQQLLERYFEKVTKRGPTAYAELRAILKALGRNDALQILNDVDEQSNGSPFVSIRENTNSMSADIVDNRPRVVPAASTSVVVNTQNQNEDVQLIPHTDPVVGQSRDVIKSDRIHTDDVVGTYAMHSERNRGVLLVVNIIDFLYEENRRNGAEVDVESLIHVFRAIGFTIFSYTNLSQDNFLKYLKKLINSQYLRDTECFVMVLMTHGKRCNEVDMVQFSDGSYGEVKEIISYFQADVCPNLVHKPKVLIFPFCRGERPDFGKVASQAIQTDGVQLSSVPTLSDVLVCYASTPGYETHRDPVEGSWYIQKFCDAMAEHAHNTSLEDILKRTQTAAANMRTRQGSLQMGGFDNLGFNKKLYFNPGFFY